MEDRKSNEKTPRQRGRKSTKPLRGFRKARIAKAIQVVPKHHVMPVAPGFHERLTAVRFARGMTQRELEIAAGLPETSLSRYEKDGGPVPRFDVRIKLARALGCSYEDLVNPWKDKPVVPDGQNVISYRNRFTGPYTIAS